MKATGAELLRTRNLVGYDGGVGVVILPVYDEEGVAEGIAVTGERHGKEIKDCVMATAAEMIANSACVLARALTTAINQKDVEVATNILEYTKGLEEYLNNNSDDGESSVSISKDTVH